MDSKFKQYAIIASQWVPNNPIRTFMPFIYNYIVQKKPQKLSLEDISTQIDELYGLHLTYPLLRSILQSLEATKEASQKRGVWTFNLLEKHQKTIVDNGLEQETNELIDDFMNFLGHGYDRKQAERLLNSFFSRYDYEIFNAQIPHVDGSSFSDYDYFVAEYIKSLEKQSSPKLELVIKMSQGSIIKSAITSENLNLTVFSNKKFYFDTKILFRLLGYYGLYYESEYKDLISKLNSQSAKLYITEYVYNEALSILRGCEKYIDSADYQYEKASDVLRYFRALNLTKENIQQKITTFEDVLKEDFNIIIDKNDIFGDDGKRYIEDYNRIKKIVVDRYGYTNNEFSYVSEHGVETDLKSVLHAYIKRANNSIVLIKDSPLFFVTTNAPLIKSVMQYNLEEYGRKLSPIISDTLLGVLLYSNDNKLDEYSKLSLLAFCNEAFRPTKEQRENFIACVEKARADNKITANQTFLLKHYQLIDDVLVRQLRENDFQVNDDCVYDTLKEIDNSITSDVSEAYERKLAQKSIDHETEKRQIIKDHETEMNKEKEKHQNELTEERQSYEKQIEAIESDNAAFKEGLLQDEYNKFKKVLYPIFYIILVVIVGLATFIALIPVIWIFETKWQTIVTSIASAIMGLADIVAFITAIIKKGVPKLILQKKEIKLKEKYKI